MTELIKSFKATPKDTVKPSDFSAFVEQAKSIKGCM